MEETQVPKKTLAELIHDLSVIENLIVEQDGELSEEDINSLEITHEQLESKLKAYRYRYKAIQAQRDANKEEVKRIQGRGKTMDNIVDTIKDKMLEAIIAFGEVNPKTNSKFLKYSDVTFFTVTTKQLTGNLEQLIIDLDEIFMEVKETPLNYRNIASLLPLIDDKLQITNNYLNSLPSIEERESIDMLELNGKVIEFITALLDTISMDITINIKLAEMLYSDDSTISDVLYNNSISYQHQISVGKKELSNYIETYGDILPYVELTNNITYRDK